MIRIYAAFDELLWAMRLNLLWLAFTLAGGVLLGVGPATVAAYTLARRHAQGETFPAWAEFLAVYRREFVRGSLLVLPAVAAGVLLIGNYLYFATTGATVPRLATLLAMIVLVIVMSYLLPIYVHYDLRPRDYLPRASLFALTRPAATILLLFVLWAVASAATLFPLLAPTIAVGAWIQLNTWLCLRFFAENEARLLAKGN